MDVKKILFEGIREDINKDIEFLLQENMYLNKHTELQNLQFWSS